MPFKHNARHRDKFEKAKYRVTNWSEYNESLRQRGDVTVWFSEDAVAGWSAPRGGKRGAQRHCSDLAIEACLTLRVVFGLALRQMQGFVRGLLRLMKIDVPVPDFSTLCRRAQSLQIRPSHPPTSAPITLIVDSTGLRVHGGRFIGDGACDGGPTAETIRSAFGPDVELTIPPPTNAVPGDCAARNAHVKMIAEQGRMAWQKETDYGLRSRVKARIGRYKDVIGLELHSRKREAQTTETQIAVKALN